MIFIVALRVGYHCTTYYENLPNISSPSISCHKVLSVCEFVIVCQHMGCNNHNLSDESCRFWGVHPILKATHLQISLNQLEIHWISHGSFHWVSHGSGLAQGRHRFPHFSGFGILGVNQGAQKNQKHEKRSKLGKQGIRGVVSFNTEVSWPPADSLWKAKRFVLELAQI